LRISQNKQSRKGHIQKQLLSHEKNQREATSERKADENKNTHIL